MPTTRDPRQGGTDGVRNSLCPWPGGAHSACPQVRSKAWNLPLTSDGGLQGGQSSQSGLGRLGLAPRTLGREPGSSVAHWKDNHVAGCHLPEPGTAWGCTDQESPTLTLDPNACPTTVSRGKQQDRFFFKVHLVAPG